MESSENIKTNGKHNQNDSMQVEDLKYYKLTETKQARKDAEKNAKKLENRVKLLEKEKSRVMKKIEAVKKKALEIMKIKKRNLQIQQEREEQERLKQQELENKQLKIQEMKSKTEDGLSQSKFQNMSKSIRIAQNTKESLKNLRKKYHDQKQEMLRSNVENAKAIKEHEQNIKIKTEMFYEKRKKNAQKRYIENVENELNKKNDLDDKIKELEQKENELIESLQKSNQIELMAMEDLKKVLNGENPEFLENLDIEQLEQIVNSS